jgi:hypothetical protein
MARWGGFTGSLSLEVIVGPGIYTATLPHTHTVGTGGLAWRKTKYDNAPGLGPAPVAALLQVLNLLPRGGLTACLGHVTAGEWRLTRVTLAKNRVPPAGIEPETIRKSLCTWAH